MTAILGGLGAACCWAAATLCSSRSSRQIGAASVLAGVMLVGLVLVAPFVVAIGSPPEGATVAWLILAGAGNVLGLLLEYAGLRVGKVGIVAAIASTEGAVAAVLSAIAGESIPGVTAGALALIAGGVVLASLGTNDGNRDGRAGRAVPFAVGAALAFGVSLYAAGRVSGDVAMTWVLLPARLVGVLFVAIPLSMRGRLRITRRSAPLVAAAGICEVVGFASFVLGARDAVGVASVLASQFAAFAAVGAFFFFGERLRRVQVAGVGTILVGVALLALLRT
jgi:drug/metabolite transporter (DMT)-like permease